MMDHELADEYCAYCFESGFADLDELLAHIARCELQSSISVNSPGTTDNNHIIDASGTLQVIDVSICNKKRKEYINNNTNATVMTISAGFTENLWVHVLPDGLLACSKCLYRTREQRYLERHMRRHEGRYSRNPAQSRCNCTVCGRTFASNQTRSVHVKKFHMKDQLRYKCNLCGKRYLQQATLNRHLETCFYQRKSSNSLLVQRFIKKHCTT